MSDVLQRFFYEDLAEAELDRIEALLQGDESNALRFAACAAEFYGKLGLPEVPDGGGGGRLWVRAAWPRRAAWTWLALVAASGLLLRLWMGHPDRPPLTRTVLPMNGPAAGALAQAAGVPAPALPSGIGMPAPAAPSAAPARQAPASAGAVPADADPAASPLADPVTMLLEAPASGPTVLRVALRLRAPESLALRVLAPDGDPEKVLFNGAAAPGPMEFTWDGTGPRGRAAPGIYRVECAAGSFTIVRRVRIDLR